LLCVVFFSLSSCDECQDCGPLDTEPSVRIKLINADSIRLLTSIISEHQVTLEINNNESASIEARLKDEGLTIDERTQLEGRLSEIAAENQVLNELLAILNPKLVNLQRGYIRLDTLFSPGGLRGLSFRRDSAFTIPLRPDADFSTLILGFNNRKDTINLFYQRKDSLMNNRLRIFSYNLQLGKHTFNDTSRVINDRRIEVYY
jgi:hypothetical protein